MNSDEITALIIARRIKLNEKHRTTYYRRKELGTNIKIIPKELQQKRGPKPKIITSDDIEKFKPLQKRGRKKLNINELI